MRNNTVSLVLIALLSLAALYVVLPNSVVAHPAWLERGVQSASTLGADFLDLKLGLDLRGGTQVLLESDLPEGQALPDGAMDAAKSIVESRVNGLGVSEAVVQKQGTNRLIVELPGVNNPDQAVETLRSTGQLEFVDPQGAELLQGMLINTSMRPTAAADALANGADAASIPYPTQVFSTVMTGAILSNASAMQDQYNQWEISFQLTSEGSTQFSEYTGSHIGQPLAIVLDGRLLSAPRINGRIENNGVITGQFSREEADSLAVQMRYGSLPVPLKIIDKSTIGASLGADSLSKSLRAGVVGLIAVVIFMLALYRFPGILATVALILYVIYNLAIFKLIPVTLSLPGIAGFILSIGVAVDANILTFERFKEELRSGRSLRNALEASFSRAWPAIRDGHVSTLLTCLVLFWFGNTFGASVVKGFAITLAIGVGLSLFSAIVVTRAFMRSFISETNTTVSEPNSLLHI